ncbi:MAG: HEAT repeat domain-containing protein, partial [Polyangiales bacterium]
SKKIGSADVRRAALSALGRIATPPAIDAIVRAFGQYEDEKPGVGPSPAREAAVSVGLPIAPSLIALLDGTGNAAATITPAISASAAWVLGEVHPAGAGPVLEGAIRRGTIPLALGLHALAAAGDPTELPICLEHVASPDRVVRAEALVATAKLLNPENPDGRAVEPLLSSLDLAQTSEDRAEIAALLGRTGAARVAPVLVGLTAAKDEKLRLVAIDALGTLGAPAAGPALAKLLDDPIASVRLRAAVALGRAGGPDVVAPVVAKLESASADRLAVVLALGGLFERHADPASITKAKQAAQSLGNERDLLLVAIGRGKGSTALVALANGADIGARRAIAVGLGAHADATGLEKLRGLASDVDAGVRAQAVWSLGAVGSASDLPLAIKLASDGSPMVAANAIAAVGRIALRGTEPVPPALCTALDSNRPYVRANALAALRPLVLAGRAGVCDDDKARKLLAEDTNEVVRAAAGRLLAAHVAKSAPEVVARARVVLERCTISDPSGAVASVCREGLLGAAPASTGTLALVVFVTPDDGGPPEASAPYAIERPDGFLHLGTADARGAVVELLLGRGPVRLRVASPTNA